MTIIPTTALQLGIKFMMNPSNDFYEYIQDQLSNWGKIDKKRMFGVIGIYRDGLMFGVIKNDTVYLKVDNSNRSKFLDAGSETLKVFKSNSEVPSYYKLPENVLDDSNEFIEWAKEAHQIQIINSS